MLRMNISDSSADLFMRIRSPSTAPPENGLLGSTAKIATCLPLSFQLLARQSTKVDLPAPGEPVIPTTCARPVFENSLDWIALARGDPFSLNVIKRAIAL